jgi:hypothetical protein
VIFVDPTHKLVKLGLVGTIGTAEADLPIGGTVSAEACVDGQGMIPTREWSPRADKIWRAHPRPVLLHSAPQVRVRCPGKLRYY